MQYIISPPRVYPGFSLNSDQNCQFLINYLFCKYNIRQAMQLWSDRTVAHERPVWLLLFTLWQLPCLSLVKKPSCMFQLHCVPVQCFICRRVIFIRIATLVVVFLFSVNLDWCRSVQVKASCSSIIASLLLLLPKSFNCPRVLYDKL